MLPACSLGALALGKARHRGMRPPYHEEVRASCVGGCMGRDARPAPRGSSCTSLASSHAREGAILPGKRGWHLNTTAGKTPRENHPAEPIDPRNHEDKEFLG